MKKLILALTMLLMLSPWSDARADCFRSFCANRVVKTAIARKVLVQATPAVYYVPGTPSRQQGYLSEDERLSKIVARAVAQALQEVGVAQQAYSGSSGLRKCARCHAPGKAQSDKFLLQDGPLDWQTAERIQYALTETDMPERAKLTTDELKQLLIETRVVMKSALSQPTVLPANEGDPQ